MKTLIKFVLILFPVILHGQRMNLSIINTLNLDSIFTPKQGTVVIYDINADSFYVYNKNRAEEYFPAESTVKILCSIAALEQEIVKESDYFAWDSLKYKRQDWWTSEPYLHWSENQNIVSALKYSVNWYYLDLIKKMDMQKTKILFDEFDFGIIPDTLYPQYFFISNEINTNAYKQVDFLRRLYQHELNISPGTTSIILRSLAAESSLNYRLYSKTGAGEIKNGKMIAWIVGIIEKQNSKYSYALNIELPDSETLPEIQIELHDKLKRSLISMHLGIE